MLEVKKYTLYRVADISPEVMEWLEEHYDLSTARPRECLDKTNAIATGIFTYDGVWTQHLTQQEAEALMQTPQWCAPEDEP